MTSPQKVQEAVVLAAGLGTRLALGRPKFAVTVQGIPLFFFPALLAVRAGVRRLLLVVASSFLELAQQLAAPLEQLGVSVQIVPNPYPSRENGYSLLLAIPHLCTNRALLLMSDHLLPYAVVEQLLRSTGDVIVAGDRKPLFVSIDEATRIYAVNGRVRTIGKHLRSFTHVDMGAFLLNQRFLSFVMQFEERTPLLLSELVQAAVDAGLDVRLAELYSVPWTDIDTPEDLRSLLDGERRSVLDRIYTELHPLIRRCLTL